jgi:2-polyprenyl-3-methyl-5-hydroxy-6-metoxy-1,4-benzoquinol methylase
MLEVLRTKAARAGLPGLQTVLVNLPGANPQVAEAHAVDSLEGPFDLIICSMTLHHVPDPGPLLVVFRRLLAKGGALALADLDSEDGGFHQDNTGVFHFGFHREALGRLLGQAGFQDLASSTVAVIPRGRPDGTSKDYSVFLTVAR